MSEVTVETWVIDRIDDGIAVLVEDPDPAKGDPSEETPESDTQAVIEVSAELLGEHAVEGAVLRILLGDVGEPVWALASRDTASEERRRCEAEALIRELEKRWPVLHIEL